MIELRTMFNKYKNKIYDYINDESNKYLVFSCPALSGKTSMLEEIIISSYKNDIKTNPNDILFLCANRKTATDTKKRINKKRLEEKNIKFIRTKENIVSIQSVAFDILNRWHNSNPEKNPQFTYINGGTQDKFIKDIIKENKELLKKNENIPEEALKTDGFRQNLREFFETASFLNYSSQKIRELDIEHKELISKLYDKYIEKCKDKQLIDHAYMCNFAAEKYDEIKEQYNNFELILLDDYQELTPAGFHLLNTILKDTGAKLIATGCNDEKVSYFRGAVLDFEKEIKDFELIDNDKLEIDKKIMGQEVNVVTNVTSPFEQKNFIINDIQKKHLNENVPYKKFAIIAHSNSTLMSFKNELESLSLPYNINNTSVPLKNEKLFTIFCKKWEELKLEEGKNTNKTVYDNVWAIWEMIANKEQVDEYQKKAVDLENPDFAFYSHKLDIAISILDSAKKYTAENDYKNDEKNTDNFFDEMKSLEYPNDSLYHNNTINGIELLTPAGALGKHFEYVYLADFSENMWPNMKIPYSMFDTFKLLEQAGYINNDKNIEETLLKRRTIRNSELRITYVGITRSKNPAYICSVDNDIVNTSEFLDYFQTKKEIKHEPLGYFLSKNEVENYIKALIIKGDNSKEVEPSRDDAIFEKQHISPSKFETAHKCPLRFFFDSMNIAEFKSNHATIGSIIHKVAENYSKKIGEKMNEKTANDLKKEVWNKIKEAEYNGEIEYSSNFEKEKLKQKIEICIKNLIDFFKQYAKPLDTDVVGTDGKTGAEVKLKYEDNFIKTSGIFDRLEIHDGDKVIIDYKTGKKSSNYTDYRYQMELYVKILEKELIKKKKNKVALGAEILHLGDFKDENEPVDGMTKGNPPKRLGDINNNIDDIIKESAKNVAKPILRTTSEKKFCGFCEYKISCPYKEEGGSIYE